MDETKKVSEPAGEVVLRRSEASIPQRLSPRTAYPPNRDWAEATHRVMDGASAFGRVFWKGIKLGICVMLDATDMVMVGWIGVGEIWEVIAALITVALWGNNGWWALLELADPTELLDPWIPTCTIIALASWNNN